MSYRILSLDGGGIRGVLTARLLHRILKKEPNFLHSVDLYAGTSTGSILATALAANIAPSRIVNFYRDSGPKVFSYPFLNKLRSLWGISSSRYNMKSLDSALYDIFGDAELGSIPTNLLVSSFKLDSQTFSLKPVRSWNAKFFHNFNEPDNKDMNLKVSEVIMRSCSAPVYFPIRNGFVDGGVCANNPSVCALAQSLHNGQNLSNVKLLSVGTGVNSKYLTSINNKWGLAQWNTNVVEMILDGSVGVADYQCREIMGNSYMRFNPELGINIGIDAVNQVDELVDIADKIDLAPILAWIRHDWNK